MTHYFTIVFTLFMTMSYGQTFFPALTGPNELTIYNIDADYVPPGIDSVKWEFRIYGNHLKIRDLKVTPKDTIKFEDSIFEDGVAVQKKYIWYFGDNISIQHGYGLMLATPNCTLPSVDLIGDQFIPVDWMNIQVIGNTFKLTPSQLQPCGIATETTIIVNIATGDMIIDQNDGTLDPGVYQMVVVYSTVPEQGFYFLDNKTFVVF